MDVVCLVDTSAWIFALRRKPVVAVAERLRGLLDLDLVATCGLIELELLCGTANEAEFERLRMRLRGLRRIQVTESHWEGAARLAYSLRRVGVTVPFTDVLLAAIAIAEGAVLLHADGDFDLMAKHCDLRVESMVATVAAREQG